MLTRQELKANAKNSLSGKYGNAVIVVVLFALIISIGSYLFESTENDYLIIFGSLIIYGFFQLGFISYFLKLSRNEEVEIGELWSKYTLFLPYIVVTVLVCIFTTLWTLLFIIPGIIASLSYSMVYFIILDNPEIGYMDAIKESKEIMNGHKMDLFLLHLSFLGWALLGILTFGILYLWLIPYVNVTICNFYNEIRKKPETEAKINSEKKA